MFFMMAMPGLGFIFYAGIPLIRKRRDKSFKTIYQEKMARKGTYVFSIFPSFSVDFCFFYFDTKIDVALGGLHYQL